MDSDIWKVFVLIVVPILSWGICFGKTPFACGRSSRAYRDRSKDDRVTQLVTSVYLGARVAACRKIYENESEWWALLRDYPVSVAYVCVFEKDARAHCVMVDSHGTISNMKREWQFAVSTQEGVQRVMAPILPRDLARAYLEIAVPGYLNHAREA